MNIIPLKTQLNHSEIVKGVMHPVREREREWEIVKGVMHPINGEPNGFGTVPIFAFVMFKLYHATSNTQNEKSCEANIFCGLPLPIDIQKVPLNVTKAMGDSTCPEPNLTVQFGELRVSM